MKLKLRLRAATLLVALVMALPAAPAVQAQVDPSTVCAIAGGQAAFGLAEERIFCEAMDSVGFVQFEQFEAGLLLLEETFPDYLHVKVIGESVLGLPLYFVEITNENSTVPRGDKVQVGYSASIHANEAAGREGMIRVLEDLAAGRGPHGAELQPLLDHLIVNVWFPNPDSWASGDYFRSDATGVLDDLARFGFHRENALGVDLNREFPNPGWIEPDHTPMSEPESKAVVNELRFSGNHSNLAAAADLHGMINSPNMIRMIIPNQDYDFRRMVLVVRQLETIRERVADDPSFAEWTTVDEVVANAEGIELPVCSDMDPTGLVEAFAFSGCLDASDVHDEPFLWGSRWDQIGYTDTGFTSDYLTLSPRSPTGGMGAVGGITEFAYSHIVPDNRYVSKLTDMHVAGVRQIVRTQMEMALELSTPILEGTGPVAYAWTPEVVSSADDPNVYKSASGRAFDADDPEARFDFDQVPYEVTNLNFWRDLGRFSSDPVEPLATEQVSAAALADYEHFILTDQVIESLTDAQVADVAAWVESGGNLLLTDGSLRFLGRAGLVGGSDVKSLCVYVGHSVLDPAADDHPLLEGVTWNARVTGESSPVGFKSNSGRDWNYPQWGIDRAAFEAAGGDVVGTTTGHDAPSDTCTNQATDPVVTMGRLPAGSGTIDLIGGALPLPTQAYDHRYGLADYSVSALTYWMVANSLGGSIEWTPIDAPFVPTYDFDPLYGKGSQAAVDAGDDEDASGLGFVVLVGALGAAAFVVRRRHA
ncbi:MAG: M14 family zinc carboxypeptidase [Thermoplasmatota archaeon]